MKVLKKFVGNDGMVSKTGNILVVTTFDTGLSDKIKKKKMFNVEQIKLGSNYDGFYKRIFVKIKKNNSLCSMRNFSFFLLAVLLLLLYVYINSFEDPVKFENNFEGGEGFE